ncbi:MAG TPA: hypothetical protein ENN29_10345 [Candidatus Hydrogenedentes bacterium]|nr:hypothetical protein [Candidatus Hydrogenedentota bacterium]
MENITDLSLPYKAAAVVGPEANCPAADFRQPFAPNLSNTQKLNPFRHSRENGNPSGVNSSSCIFRIPVFTGMTVVVVYRSNGQKIVSQLVLSAYEYV